MSKIKHPCTVAGCRFPTRHSTETHLNVIRMDDPESGTIYQEIRETVERMDVLQLAYFERMVYGIMRKSKARYRTPAPPSAQGEGGAS